MRVEMVIVGNTVEVKYIDGWPSNYKTTYTETEAREIAIQFLHAANDLHRIWENQICWCGHLFKIHNISWGSGGCELCPAPVYPHNPSLEKGVDN